MTDQLNMCLLSLKQNNDADVVTDYYSVLVNNLQVKIIHTLFLGTNELYAKRL